MSDASRSLDHGREQEDRTQDDKDSETMKQDEEAKMEKEMARAREAAAHAPEAAARALGNAVACYIESLGSCTEPLLGPQSARPTAPSAASTDTVATPPLLMPKEPDDTWNKPQIGYIFALGTAVGLVFFLQPHLPAAYNCWMLFVIAMVWGVGSVGLPFGLHGTARWEKDCSRHIGRLVFAFFSVLMIFGFYLLALHVDGAAASIPSPSPLEVQASTDRDADVWCSVGFGVIGISVLVGHLISWIRGCCTGGDRDRDP